MLEQEIRSDIEERQRLMLKIKTLHLRYRFNEEDEQLFLNYSIPAVYAIWEGFVTTTFHTYIAELNKLNLTADSVCDSILVQHFEKKFGEYPTKNSGKKDQTKDKNTKVKFLKKVSEFYANPIINIPNGVNTESNVKFKTLNNILLEFGLSILENQPIVYSELSNHHELPLKSSLSEELQRLLDNRNKVAHGQNSVVIYRSDLERAIKLIEVLMDLVFEKIVDGFNNKSYLTTRI